MLPFLSAVSGSPNAAARALFRNGRIDSAFGPRMKDDRVTPVVLARNKCLPFPGDARIGGSIHAAKVFAGRADFCQSDAADKYVFRVERIDGDRTDAFREDLPLA